MEIDISGCSLCGRNDGRVGKVGGDNHETDCHLDPVINHL